MASELNVPLSDSLLAWIDQQAIAEGYPSSAEFIVQLVDQERKRRLMEQVDRELLAAIEEGPSEPLTSEDWQAIRREGQARLKARRDSP